MRPLNDPRRCGTPSLLLLDLPPLDVAATNSPTQGGSNGVRFLFMAEWTRLLKGSAEATLRPVESFVGGMVSGLAAVLSTQPMDVVKTRLQAAGSARRYAGTLDCLKQIVRDEGAATLYSGTIARAARVLPGSGIIFMSAELIYNALDSRRRSRAAEAAESGPLLMLIHYASGLPVRVVEERSTTPGK